MLSEEELHATTLNALHALDLLVTHTVFSDTTSSDVKPLASASAATLDRLQEVVRSTEKRIPDLSSTVRPAYLCTADVEALQKLSDADLQVVDECIISFISKSWRKNAYIVGSALLALSDRYPDLSDVSYVKRLKYLAVKFAFEVKGDIDLFGYCELRYGSETIRS